MNSALGKAVLVCVFAFATWAGAAQSDPNTPAVRAPEPGVVPTRPAPMTPTPGLDPDAEMPKRLPNEADAAYNARLLLWREQRAAAALRQMRGAQGPADPTAVFAAAPHQLDLTPEQRQNIQTLRDSSSGSMREAFVAYSEACRTVNDLTLAGQDEKALRAAADKVGKALGDLQVLRMKLNVQLLGVLTPEQLKKLEDIKSQPPQPPMPPQRPMLRRPIRDPNMMKVTPIRDPNTRPIRDPNMMRR